MGKDREQESVNEPATDSLPAADAAPARVRGAATEAEPDRTGSTVNNDNGKSGFGTTAEAPGCDDGNA
jgi:hypothetical protein